MRLWNMAWIAMLLLLFACQPAAPAAAIAVVDGAQLRVVMMDERSPDAVLARAGVLLGPADALLYNGYPLNRGASLPGTGSGTLQVLRAARVSVNGKAVQTVARTVGEALAEAGQPLHVADSISPLATAGLNEPIAIRYSPARELTIKVDGKEIKIMSAASTVSAALARAGLPLLGLDYSKPAENAALPADGQIQLVRVSESVVFAQKSIPFKTESKSSPDVPLGTEQIVQPGLPGLSVSHVRIRYENGIEVARQTESETVARPPQDRVVVQGTKIVIQTTTIGGTTIQYWRQMQMYATTYSPCNSGTGGCSWGTASGLRAGKGVVAVDPSLYAYLNGQRLYIPGYGSAVIGDIGGGYIVEQMTGVSRYKWIDLGYDEGAMGNLIGWITVYFLAPAPATIPDILQ
jgi:uncharacterized protein YabE (DUF348 family)